MRLKTIKIRGFRGFNREQTIPLDHDVILIYGLNGSGKSSVVEALEWLFFGDISRRARSSCRSEYMSNYLRNVHYDEPENPFVEVTGMLNGAERVIKKDLIGVAGHHCYVGGDLVDDFSCLGISLENHSKPILSQGEIRGFVDTEQKDRWEEVSKILGLEIFSVFRTELQELRTKLQNRDEYQRALKQKNAAVVHLQNKKWLPTVVEAASQTPYSHGSVVTALETELATIVGKKVELGEAGAVLEHLRDEILRRVQEPKGLNLLEVQTGDLPEVEAEELLTSIRGAIEQFGQLSEQSVEQDYVKFLHLGLRLLKGRTCPFCEKETISEEKEMELRERLETHQPTLESIERLEKQITIVKEKSQALSEALDKHLPDLPKFSLAAEQLQPDALWHSDGVAVQRVVEQRVPAAQETIREVALMLDGLQQVFTKLLHAQTEFDQQDLNGKANILEQKLRAAMTVIQAVKSEIERIRNSIVGKAKGLSEDDKNKFELVGFISDLIGQLRYFKVVGAYQDKIGLLTQLISAADRFEKQRTGELLGTLSSKIREYYEKLNPGEQIQFKEIVPSPGISRQVRLKAESYGQEINPVTCFSEAHMNSLGISLYFPQRVDYNPDWDFILLDDPIQSMDDDHSNMLIDILQEHQGNKQIIGLSHSRHFCEIFEARFGRENILRYEFTQGDETGPRISLQDGPIRVLLERAQELAHGSFEERKTAGGHLRKAIERFFVEYLATKGQDKISLFKLPHKKLGERARSSAGFPDSDWRDIDAILTYANPAAHGQDPKDIKPGDLNWGIRKLEELTKNYHISG